MAYVVNTTSFAILAPPDNLVIGARIAAEFPANFLQLWPGQWIIVASGTAKEISDVLGISEGKSGVAIVFAISGYFGWAANPTWEWIAAKLGQDRSA
jgi:hypothetical protein